MKGLIGVLWGASLMGGCVSAGFGATDTLGVVGHEMAANAYERSAAAHRQNAGDFTPAGCMATLTGCPPGTINWRAANEFEQAERDQRMANQHRARVEELRAAEERACAGLDEDERAMRVFAVDQVERVESDAGSFKGIIVRVQNERGVAADRFERIVRCRVARNAARGVDVGGPDMCPLVPGAEVSVRAEGSNVSVTITPVDDAAVKALERCSPSRPRVFAGPSRLGGAS